MATRLGPRTRKVIGHEVDEVQMNTCLSQVDVPQGPLACWKSRCERIIWERERSSQSCEELNIVIPLMRVRWMLPIDYGRQIVSDATHISFACGKTVLLSIPLRLYVSTRLLALWANVNLVWWLAATAAKLALFSPPPPTERRILSCGYCRFTLFRAFKHPFVPSTSI